MKRYRNLRTKRKFRILKQKAIRNVSSFLSFTVSVFILTSVGLLLTSRNVQAETPSQTISSETVVTGAELTPVTALNEFKDTLKSLPIDLSGNLENDQKSIRTFLELKGEDVDRWFKIIKGESKFGTELIAPTYWSLCDRAVVVQLWGYTQPANSFIELRDYPNGIWQANCEEYGARTIRTGYSKGLVHIIETTWEFNQCSGDVLNWIDNLECAFKIRNNQGWNSWSTN